MTYVISVDIFSILKWSYVFHLQENDMRVWLLNILYIIYSTFPGKFSYLLFSFMHCCP